MLEIINKQNQDAQYNIKENKIDSLQGLRALAFFGVFLSHTAGVQSGGWGVSVFLVLSGFLMSVKHYDDTNMPKSILTSIKYSFKKIKDLYMLHFLAFFLAIPLCYKDLSFYSIKKICISVLKVVFNLLLLQSWIPKSEFYFSFNSVSWYLSVALFLYIWFPYMMSGLRKLEKKNHIVLLLVILYEMGISGLLYVFGEKLQVSMVISDDLVKYITYICPLYRIGDFAVGMILGCIYISRNIDNNEIFNGIMQLIAVMMIPVLIYIYKQQIGLFGDDSFRYSLLYLLDAALLVYYMCRNGFIAKLLSMKAFVFLGDLSSVMFLLHQLIYRYLVLYVYSKHINVLLLRSMITLVMTIIISYAYKLISVCSLKTKMVENP